MGRCCTVAFREDYDNWASWGNTEWSYEQVLPYFRKMENDHDCGGEFHGKAGPVPVRRYQRDSGCHRPWPFTGPVLTPTFAMIRTKTIRSPWCLTQGAIRLMGVHISMAMAYLDPARHRLNLTIKGNSWAAPPV